MCLKKRDNAIVGTQKRTFLLFRFCRALRGGKRGAKTACFYAFVSC